MKDKPFIGDPGKPGGLMLGSTSIPAGLVVWIIGAGCSVKPSALFTGARLSEYGGASDVLELVLIKSG